ncbi:putative glycerol kinase 5 isoform X1 [Neodiprion lecontei]|uniref:Glycerol kinase 5 n=1 Tax=Neodiprion lecontei TaxID=441921 RepID=A0A6J0BP51_NEOLC|nr:putative glycerol kinase 5 isoform X1 [Neodiprion lecontei]
MASSTMLKYVAALDVGTTTVRCHIIDKNVRTIGAASEKVEIIYPKPGYVEIDPDRLWETIIRVMKDALQDANLEANQITCIGISTQRGSFTTWNRETGKHYHNFITWKDLRADQMVKDWNSSLTMKGLRSGAHFLYMISGSKRFLAGSVLKLMNTQTTLRLTWALHNVPGLKEAAMGGKAVFGGVDCWLLYKFTGKHVTDASSASATGLFDPFTMQWAGWAIKMFKLPRHMFPEVVDTAGNFGNVPKNLFGAEIPIRCSMADQAASLFGSTSFQPGDLKITLGTGTFVNVNTGTNPHASLTGLYPLVGWRLGAETIYVVEGASNDTGSLIEWAKSIGIINEPEETSDLAKSVKDSDGVYFIPAFSGLQAPINDHTAAAGFLAVKPTSSKAHLVRSILESIVFRILLIYESLQQETEFTYHRIRVDGGVSKNDFMMQLLADVTGLQVERAISSEMSILGVAFLAGLSFGVWNSREELLQLREVEKVFSPKRERQQDYQAIVELWQKAVERFKDWY